MHTSLAVVAVDAAAVHRRDMPAGRGGGCVRVAMQRPARLGNILRRGAFGLG